MFNLIMKGAWVDGRETFPLSRMLEDTVEATVARFKAENGYNFSALAELPCLFMEEGTTDEIARVGRISDVRSAGGEVKFNCALDPDLPGIRNSTIYRYRHLFDKPDDWYFSRNHWAVKNINLFEALLKANEPARQWPSVFKIDTLETIQRKLLSVMMPFAANFTPVYQAIQEVAKDCGLICQRGDDIWNEDAVIQDVVSLIDTSRIVICDLSGRNPNVFYETGIAHTLGRPVIMIVQNGEDIPFDLRHLRYVTYHNNGEGRETLKARIKPRIEKLLDQ